MKWYWDREKSEYAVRAIGVKFRLREAGGVARFQRLNTWQLIVGRGEDEWIIGGFSSAPAARYAAKQIARIVATVVSTPRKKSVIPPARPRFKARICGLCEAPFEADVGDGRELCSLCEKETGCQS
jgi:hypothetical protein